ncbi:MAG TPA: energy transducer TonB [Woeseiaceae bacterium]|nr:energy transducer TonB [Woeseiaceae bacterium]
MTADEPAGDTDAEAASLPDPAISDASAGRRDPAVTKFPSYPALARRRRIEGEATVCFKVAPDGRVLEAEVASSTHEIFEEPALEAILQSSFEPLAPGEELVPTICRTYRFRLDPVTDS